MDLVKFPIKLADIKYRGLCDRLKYKFIYIENNLLFTVRGCSNGLDFDTHKYTDYFDIDHR